MSAERRRLYKGEDMLPKKWISEKIHFLKLPMYNFSPVVWL